MSKTRSAKFKIGQVVRHRLYPFRGVVFDIDPEFNNTEEWWQAIPEETAEFLERLDQVQHDYQGQDPMPREFVSEVPPGSQLYEMLFGFYPAVIEDYRASSTGDVEANDQESAE